MQLQGGGLDDHTSMIVYLLTASSLPFPVSCRRDLSYLSLLAVLEIAMDLVMERANSQLRMCERREDIYTRYAGSSVVTGLYNTIVSRKKKILTDPVLPSPVQ